MTKANKTDRIRLCIDAYALGLLVVIPWNPKESPKRLRRLARIRQNLVRELLALNKEINRHKPSVEPVLLNGYITL